jgi:lipoprotein Spr
MIKYILTTTIMIVLASYSPVLAQNATQIKSPSAKSDIKFINNIEIDLGTTPTFSESKISGPKVDNSETFYSTKNTSSKTEDVSIEKASQLQLKYSLLLDTEVELVRNLNIFNLIDEWFGTRYRYGGESKSGIDCSALMQTFFGALFGIALPRTAREQYAATKKIEKSELQEGDLVFFNTTGGISHVGMYLQNNKFVHASSSGGVTISDLDESYWAKRYVNAGRYDKASETLAYSKPRP